MSDPESVNWFQTIGGVLVTFFSGFALLIAKRTTDSLDSKADKETVRDKFEEIQQDIRDMMDRQDRQHADNTARLDGIWKELRK